MEKDIKIKEIALNPKYIVEEVYRSLENQGISVRWMTDEETNDEELKKVIYY